jgi:hypothetical protein
MTAQEVFELTTQGGATDFSEVVRVCRSLGSYCLIGGLAVNCYAEPVYTMDAQLALIPGAIPEVPDSLRALCFAVETIPPSINAQRGASQLRIQFTTDERYREFPTRAREWTVLGEIVAVASLEDVFQGKVWAWSDPSHRLTKRKKDELDLLRLAEAHSSLCESLPVELRNLLP